MKIHSIKLETAHLSGVVDFYRSVLGLHTASVEPGTVHVQIGNSWLVFAENPGFTGIYHFAFNIPCNQIREGMAWLERSNIDLIANEKGEKQMDFADWHAEATYFFDPAGNIVELIARRDLQNESDRPFGRESLLEISEVGIVCPDVLAWSERAATEHELAALTGLEDFHEGIALLAPDLPVLVVTRSEKGAVAISGGEQAEVRAEPVARVVDTTGAGDLFAAGFLFGHVRGRPLAECLRLGAICAAEVISHYGARPEADLKALLAARLG